ncbi:hypothetical protein ACHAO7_010080 [Fusarium culmorum]
MAAQETALKMVGRLQGTSSSSSSQPVCDEYLEDIIRHMRHMENVTLPDMSLIDTQPEIQWYMRPYLVDFLIEAHAELGLLPETLFRTMNLVDRYCSKRVVYKKHYQLLGCAALLLATKYAEKRARIPSSIELHDFCCGLYAHGMFAQMETHVLESLDWTLGNPTADFFLQLAVVSEGDDEEVAALALYLCEIALYHRDFVSTKPSIMAQSALTHARSILGRIAVDSECWGQTGSVDTISLWHHLHKPSPTVAHKYSTARFSEVSGKLALFIARPSAVSHATAEITMSDGISSGKILTDVSSSTKPWKNIGDLDDPPAPHYRQKQAANEKALPWIETCF